MRVTRGLFTGLTLVLTLISLFALRLAGTIPTPPPRVANPAQTRAVLGRQTEQRRTPSREDVEKAERFYERGTQLLLKNDFDSAIKEFRKALEFNPDFAEAHGKLGLALKRKGDLDGAIAEFREVVRLSPDNPIGHHHLGLALATKGDLTGAVNEFRQAIRLNPHDPG